jgi:hypothetical protein
MKRNWMQKLVIGLTGAVVATSLVGCGSAGLLSPNPLGTADTVEVVKRGPGGVTRFMARNVIYRLDKNVSMILEDMNTDIVLKDPSMPFVPANKSEFSIQIHHAKVRKDAQSLEALMNTYVFNDSDSPLRNLKISFKDDRIVMGGQMKKGVWVGFEMEGTLSPTPDGKILMTPKVIKSMGVRVDGLMGLIGLEMAKLMKMKEEKGLALNGNTIIMDPAKLYPPPTLNGKITSVSIRNNELNLEFNDGRAQPWPDVPVKNTKSTLLMWGGDVLINKTLALDAKMQILDATPESPMVFALDFYREQIEAGYVVPTRQGHMITYVPDIWQYTPNYGRYAPTFPVPGIVDRPSDLPKAGMSNQEDDEKTGTQSRTRAASTTSSRK